MNGGTLLADLGRITVIGRCGSTRRPVRMGVGRHGGASLPLADGKEKSGELFDGHPGENAVVILTREGTARRR